MREGYDNDMLTLPERTEVIGVNLGSDHCAEHEWGIKGIKQVFGMKEDALGLDKRIVTVVAPELQWVEGKIRRGGNKTQDAAGFWVNKYNYNEPGGEKRVFELPDVHLYSDSSTLWTGWSEGDLGALSTDSKQIDHLRHIFKAFGDLDIAIWLGGGGVFKNAGLVIAIASELPKKITKQWYDSDVSYNKLMADFKATGIEEKLRKAGKRYFALSPRRKADGGIEFWLNPMDQKNDYWGVVTLKDLEDWIMGKGKIPQNKKEARQ
jgi:hypothetical protein